MLFCIPNAIMVALYMEGRVTVCPWMDGQMWMRVGLVAPLCANKPFAMTLNQQWLPLCSAFVSSMAEDADSGLIREGKAAILQHGNEVFYNKAQVINRDLSIAVLKYFAEQREAEIASGKLNLNKRKRLDKQRQAVPISPPVEDTVKGLKVLEGLAASGLRAVRYALEVPQVGRVVAAELDEKVVEVMKKNIDVNGPEAKQKVQPLHVDTRLHMLQNPGVYDAVDLDPYGTPVQFLDSAVQCVSEGGLLMVTATDMAVLCGNNASSCWVKYGCYALHRPYMHEQALRILLACIEGHAVRYKRHIVPVLSLSVDFYIRVFVRIYTDANATKASATKLSYIYQSQGCDSFYLQPVAVERTQGKQTKFTAGTGPVVPQACVETGSGFLVGGPIWSAPIHDIDWVRGILSALEQERANYKMFEKVQGLLTAASEELQDVPLYINVHEICKTVKTFPPRADAFASAIKNAGHRVSGTHVTPLGLKTDAPWQVIWDVMRTWVRDHPGKAQDPDSYSGRLLSRPILTEVRFSHGAAGKAKAKKGGVRKYLPNPEENWGPKSRHGRRPGVGGKGRECAEVEAAGTSDGDGGDAGDGDEVGGKRGGGGVEDEEGRKRSKVGV
ncbi:unnamed protein product [Ostreobium quekettii]|uniref:tRNA (guanine(26)-N(2))-dimethyltransferase n=1 Tax=Ostreobium quekettii TaxID=121088 RepID=A0A8S1J6X8_9CHLO|nr:unnamed protein product [Ostreobium quekettii]|eukprot:evm.model.scf_1361.4 EVM.evm.TU.scf_1361.4   scf_1361:28962-37728(-)